MRSFVIVMVCVVTLLAQGVHKPLASFQVTHGMASDIVYGDGLLYIASDAGVVDIYDTKKQIKQQTLHLGKIKDFMGDEVDSKIFSLDYLDGRVLILSQDNNGYSRLHIYEGGKLKPVFDATRHLNVIKAAFIDKERVLLALISNDILSYAIKTGKIEWSMQASQSKFSTFALNGERSGVAVSDESGDVHILETKTGRILKQLSGMNVDNVFSIDYKGGVVLTGAQDRRAAVYDVQSGTGYYKQASFFVYGVGLSPSGKRAAYSCDMQNNVTLFHTQTRQNLGKFRSTGKIVNKIYFIDEDRFFILSSAPSVGLYDVRINSNIKNSMIQ